MVRSPLIPPVTGLLAIFLLALLAARTSGGPLTTRLSEQAGKAIAEIDRGRVTAHFATRSGMPSRHPLLTGGLGLDDGVRDRIAKAVGALPGVGGVRWEGGSVLAQGAAAPVRPLNCQDEVQALLRARTIRFEEGSARIDAASSGLVGEVANALRPCLGSIIAITGHTDASGTEPGNLALSRERAEAVRQALMDRGIPADGLRARGVGSSLPVEGLEPTDPANRRIEFSVIETLSIKPTPVDTPGPR